MGLIDQIHRAEPNLTALVTALQAEPEEIRRRIGLLLQQQGS